MSACPTTLEHMPAIEAIFSDMDGTLVHYEKTMVKQGYRLLTSDGKISTTSAPSAESITPGFRTGVAVERVAFLHEPTQTTVTCLRVPSLTLGGGYVSEATLDLVDTLRDAYNVRMVLMTGARTSTMLMRRKSATIPAVDYDVCEGGGKVWEVLGRPALEDPTLDPSWTEQFLATTGPAEQLDSDPLSRVGPLWEAYRILHGEGFHLDAKSFSTSFLVDVSKSALVVDAGKSIQEVERYLKDKFATLSSTYPLTYVTNLGKGQVCAVGCNKRTAMMYLAQKLGVAMETRQEGDAAVQHILPTSIALFDDENDLEFAAACGAGFIPSVAHDSVLEALEKGKASGATPLRWWRTPIEGPLGTDYALREIVSFMATKAPPPAA